MVGRVPPTAMQPMPAVKQTQTKTSTATTSSVPSGPAKTVKTSGVKDSPSASTIKNPGFKTSTPAQAVKTSAVKGSPSASTIKNPGFKTSTPAQAVKSSGVKDSFPAPPLKDPGFKALNPDGLGFPKTSAPNIPNPQRLFMTPADIRDENIRNYEQKEFQKFKKFSDVEYMNFLYSNNGFNNQEFKDFQRNLNIPPEVMSTSGGTVAPSLSSPDSKTAGVPSPKLPPTVKVKS